MTLSPHFLLRLPGLLQARGKIRVLPLLQPARLHIQEMSLQRKKATLMSPLYRGWAIRILERLTPPTSPHLEEHHLLLTVALLLAWIKDSKGRTLYQRLTTISSPALPAKHPPSGKRRLAFGVLREAIVKGRKFLELQTWNPHASAKRVCPTITSGGMRRLRARPWHLAGWTLLACATPAPNQSVKSLGFLIQRWGRIWYQCSSCW